jgi:hypothetical protein
MPCNSEFVDLFLPLPQWRGLSSSYVLRVLLALLYHGLLQFVRFYLAGKHLIRTGGKYSSSDYASLCNDNLH